jgi:predicted ATPase
MCRDSSDHDWEELKEKLTRLREVDPDAARTIEQMIDSFYEQIRHAPQKKNCPEDK